jgi:thymidylate kinase
MIISLRGTNGAGKSTIVRKILNQYPEIKALKLPDRRKPAGYICSKDLKQLYVLGHYEIDNGGIDTLKGTYNLDEIYKIVMDMHSFGCDVLFEGMNREDNVKRLTNMHKLKLDVRVIFIDHDLHKCETSVRKRGHAIPHETISLIYKKCYVNYVQLRQAGVNCHYLKRQAAQKQIEGWLEL